MMFGIPGAALAMVRTAKNKKAAIGLVVSAAICAFVCGVTEPFEFGFMFLCFPCMLFMLLCTAFSPSSPTTPVSALASASPQAQRTWFSPLPCPQLPRLG